MERKSVKITNCKQFELMVSLMEKNPNVAKGFMSFGSTKEEYNNIWKGFSDKLNSIGLPIRKPSEWQKVWNDYKAKVKNKLSHNKKELTATGGGSNKLYTFSSLEESVIDILHLREITKIRKTFGLGPSTSTATVADVIEDHSEQVNIEMPMSRDSIEIEELDNDEYLPDRVELSPAPRPVNKSVSSRKTKEQRQEERGRMLQEHTTHLRNTERHNKEIARYTRKIFELKSKQLRLWQEDLLDRKKMRRDLLELKLREIEYKERKLNLLERSSGASVQL